MSELAPELKRELPSQKSYLDEQSKYFDAHPEDMTPDYLNNLRLRLPGSATTEQYEELGILDQKHERGSSFDSLHSSLWWEKNGREFLDDVAEAYQQSEAQAQPEMGKLQVEDEAGQERLQELNTAIKNMMDANRGLPDAERKEKFATEVRPLLTERDRLMYEVQNTGRIDRALIPLYQALRKRGYSHYDIVG